MTETTVDLNDPKVMFAELARVVEQRGRDYVYEPAVVRRWPFLDPDDPDSKDETKCLYVHDRYSDEPVPGCAVGLLIHNVTGRLPGPDVEDKQAGPALRESGLVRSSIGAAAQMAARFQLLQDEGTPYGEALDSVRDRYGDLLLP